MLLAVVVCLPEPRSTSHSRSFILRCLCNWQRLFVALLTGMLAKFAGYKNVFFGENIDLKKEEEQL